MWSRLESEQSRHRRLTFVGAGSRQGILLGTDVGAVKNRTTTYGSERGVRTVLDKSIRRLVCGAAVVRKLITSERSERSEFFRI